MPASLASRGAMIGILSLVEAASLDDCVQARTELKVSSNPKRGRPLKRSSSE